MTDAYEFRIAGHLSPDLLRTFDVVSSYREPGQTVFVRAVGDDGELFGVIARCETLHLKLVGLRQLAEGSDPVAP